MLWFRSHHGAPFDTKLALVAKRANVTRGHAASLWWAVLDYASQAKPRGNVSGLDPEEVAAAFDYDEDDVKRVLDAMRQKEILIGPDGMLTAWDKRQVSREDNSATERKRRQRSRTPETASRNVTKSHALDLDRDRDSEREKEKEEAGAVPDPPPSLDKIPHRMMADWNALAEQTGLPKAERLTKGRRAKARLRWRDAGGKAGWENALAKIRGSPFLLGENPRGWRANFDFVLQESSFLKLIEGAYSGGNGQIDWSDMDDPQ